MCRRIHTADPRGATRATAAHTKLPNTTTTSSNSNSSSSSNNNSVSSSECVGKKLKIHIEGWRGHFHSYAVAHDLVYELQSAAPSI